MIFSLLILISICILALLLFIYVNIFYYLYLKVPMLSTEKETIRKLSQNIDFSKAKNFYDLGSGNGKVISAISGKFPNLECVGIECNIAAFLLAKVLNIFSSRSVRYRMENFMNIDLGEADVIYAYLFPGAMEKLEEKFSKELKRGTLVVSSTFPIKDKIPKLVVKNENGKLGTLYIYEY
jgi:hypothetical protein